MPKWIDRPTLCRRPLLTRLTNHVSSYHPQTPPRTCLVRYNFLTLERKFRASAVSPERSGIATKIGQLIVDGKSKTALDNAKEFHKEQGSAESEILLIDAYLARIRALF